MSPEAKHALAVQRTNTPLPEAGGERAVRRVGVATYETPVG